jgi:sigma-B regulation protein RsbU (phosphoserine phosphatase)
MVTHPFRLERWRELAAFDGDSAAALRLLAGYVRERLPDVSVALMLVRGQAPGTCRLAGLIGPEGTEHFPNIDPFGERAQLPLFEDELSRHVTALLSPHIVDLAPGSRGSPLAQALLAPATVLALPLVATGRFDHWLLLGSTLRGRFQVENLERLWLEFGHAVSLLARALALRTIEAVAKHQHHEIEGLAEIQRLLQPDRPSIRGLDFAIHWQPAATAAGDYYDVMGLTQFAEPDYLHAAGDMWGMILSDVSGHGAAAAMETVQFDAILRTYKGDEQPLGPAGALTYANRYFFSRRQRRHFMTVFAASSRPDKNELTYVCAGHPPALLKRGAEVRSLGAGNDGGIPLGILRDHRGDNSLTEFAPGDVLVVYTDGVVEARDARGRMFGQDRLESLLRELEPEPELIRAHICAALFEHQGGLIGADDQTLIVMRQS